jgi:hypothetical protein
MEREGTRIQLGREGERIPGKAREGTGFQKRR